MIKPKGLQLHKASIMFLNSCGGGGWWVGGDFGQSGCKIALADHYLCQTSLSLTVLTMEKK